MNRNLTIEVEDDDEAEEMGLVKSPIGKGVAYRYPTRRESLAGMGAIIPLSPLPTPVNNDQQSVALEQTGALSNSVAPGSPKRPSFLQAKSPQNKAPAVAKHHEEVS